ncbi:M14 family metallocarboxypeptidase [Gallaecimonas pentaromativorans]|uniref:M14 family metallopeptidase n=1 Tax=Gallaecimonas pentaromativorans TaxID=584787 RepID=UPI003A91AD08
MTYHIGTPGKPWGEQEKAQWLAERHLQRSYQDEVVSQVQALAGALELVQYGALSYDPERYPLLALKSPNWQPGKPYVLVTGGMHGYETSGVQGAIAFAREKASHYGQHFNLLICPCISPWGYEVINRWNPLALDPNRSFIADSQSEEAAALQKLVADIGAAFVCHIDLHETTDSDESEFRPALAARDGKVFEPGTIPDGFYVVDNSESPQPAFQQAIVEAVAKVTHIAPADPDGTIIGSKVVAPGVIEYPLKKLGLCASVTTAPYTCTTEVYPDSPKATPAICNAAQVAAVCGALEFLLAR